ncbi:MAG: carboxypeptidase-like regulatory domain-containing protein, partial [Planctomycetota bacterium]
DPSPKPRAANTEEEPPATRDRPVKPDEPDKPIENGPNPAIDTRPPSEFETPTETFRVVCRGRVVSDVSGPVANARVDFSGTGVYRALQGSAFTDDYGQYTLLAWQQSPRGTLEGGNARIIVSTSERVNGLSNIVEASNDSELVFEDIVLPAGRVLEGRVTDANGTPVHNVSVQVRGTEFLEVVKINVRKPEIQRQQIQRTATTDHGGMFRVEGLPASQYRVSVAEVWSGQTKVGHGVDLRETPSQWLDVELQPFSGVRGVVVDSNGDYLPGVSVKLIAPKPEDGTSEASDFRNDIDSGDGPRSLRQVTRRRTTTDELGRFYFGGLVTRRYGIEVRSGDEKASLKALKPSDQIHNLTLNVKSRLSGSVVDSETGAPVETFDVRLLSTRFTRENGTSPFIQVNPDNSFGYYPGGNFFVASSSQDMQFQVSSPGYAVVIAKADNSEVIKLVPLCTVSFDLKSEGGKKLALEPLVLLFENRVVLQMSSDAFGRVRIPDVVPATYSVRVFLASGQELRGELEVPEAASAALTLNVKE